MAMPSARAICFKSALAPAHTLRAFRSYPYCFCQRSSNTHCQATRANSKTKARQRLPLPLPAETFGRQASPVINEKIELLKANAKKLSMKIE